MLQTPVPLVPLVNLVLAVLMVSPVSQDRLEPEGFPETFLL